MILDEVAVAGRMKLIAGGGQEVELAADRRPARRRRTGDELRKRERAYVEEDAAEREVCAQGVNSPCATFFLAIGLEATCFERIARMRRCFGWK